MFEYSIICKNPARNHINPTLALKPFEWHYPISTITSGEVLRTNDSLESDPLFRSIPERIISTYYILAKKNTVLYFHIFHAYEPLFHDEQ